MPALVAGIHVKPLFARRQCQDLLVACPGRKFADPFYVMTTSVKRAYGVARKILIGK
jgi:hypothetical protein